MVRENFVLDILTWRTIGHIARLEEIELAELCELIDQRRGGQSFQQAARCLTVAYFRAKEVERFETYRPPKVRTVSENRSENRVTTAVRKR